MAAKSTDLASKLLKLMYQAVAWANVADNAATSPITNVYVAAHTADPNVTPGSGDQSTSEAAYTGYGRQAVARSSGGWVVATNTCGPVANVVFPVSTSGTPSITFFSTGPGASGATGRWHSGPVVPTIVVSTVVPQTLANGPWISET